MIISSCEASDDVVPLYPSFSFPFRLKSLLLSFHFFLSSMIMFAVCVREAGGMMTGTCQAESKGLAS